ncbi:ATP-dependent DNA helicase [Corynebacterium sp.]|uniref:ATP-dependent DNA helicase n=1 Tax=Corynebacterium sp. TaxID=1720 RepID=UPI0026DC2D4D|nr:ATP-dependent DNA helicase [Corynebacterium sp.]MDO4914314.1 ATP-dependent DNA helicase [Corynebacterium sp.]
MLTSTPTRSPLHIHPTKETAAHTEFQWQGTASDVINSAGSSSGTFVVKGGPGAGRSSFLRDAARAEIMAGTNPDSILFLTASKEAAVRTNRWLLSAIEQGFDNDTAIERVFSGSIARSVHSFAFAILRHQAAHTPGLLAPRLLTGAEHDSLVRDMLREHSERGADIWPERLRPALTTLGFARQLRDFLLRVAERGCTSKELRQYGQDCSRDEWSAAADFYDEYRATARLMGSNALNASELVRAAVDALDNDEELAESLSFDVILIDDSQFFDPLSSELVERFRSRARLTLVASEQSESVFRFRGGSTTYADKLAKTENTIDLPGSKRLAPPVAELAARVADATRHPESLRWAKEIRHQDAEWLSHHSAEPGDAHVRVLVSPSAEVAAVVDRVRRAHIVDKIPWKDIAVIVRSKGQAAPMRRGLLAAGVPVADDPTEIVLSEQPMVRAILQAVRCAVGEDLTNDELERMVLSPIGGGDPITFRRILRGLRRGFMKVEFGNPVRAAELTAMITTDDEDYARSVFRAIDALRFILLGGELIDLTENLTAREKDLIMRVRSVIQAGQKAFHDGESVEAILWAVWDAADLSEALANQSLRGGAVGSMADQHLDAVMSLFDAAGDYVERHPHSTITSFVRFIVEQELPTGARDRRGPVREAVDVSPAHATVGKEWDTVVVAGLQEDVWPSLSETGTIFRQEEFVDFLDRGVEPGRPENRRGRYDDRLAEERRLFLVAVTRARRSLLVTAVGPHVSDDGTVDSDADTRSRFLEEISGGHGLVSSDVENDTESSDSADLRTLKSAGGAHTQSPLSTLPECEFPRVLSPDSLIAELRRVVESEDAPSHERHHAARQLARLALAAGDAPSRESVITAANPDHWWGVQELSTTESLHDPETAYFISPSQVERYLECPLEAFLQSVETSGRDTSATLLGTLTHMAAEAMERGVDEGDVRDVFLATVPRLLGALTWKKGDQIDKWTDMFDRLVEKLHLRYAAVTGHAEVEQVIESLIGQTNSGDDVYVRGKIDRLEISDDGKYYIIDFKTGNQVASDIPENPQLKTYQTAVAKSVDQQNTSSSSVSSPPSSHMPEKSSADNCLAGAELIYPHKKPRKPTVQDPLTNDDVNAWARQLVDLALVMAGPYFAGSADSQPDQSSRSRSLSRVLVGKSALAPSFTPSNIEDAD